MKIGLADPRKLAAVLELVDQRAQKQASGIIVACPAHDDGARASCSITVGKDGTARVKCHACGFTGDALTLVACVYGLDLREDFKRVLLTGAELAGNHTLAAELEDGKPRPDRIQLPEPRQTEEAPWPDRVQEFWNSCSHLHTDAVACRLLESRGIDPARAEGLGLARVLPERGPLPKWAKYGRRDWRKTSNRIVVRSWDSDGILRSVRAWRVTAGDSPKRLPPAGCRSAGLVLSDRRGHGVLRGERTAHTLWIVEGEPDWIAATIAAPGGHAVWGIGSGGWSDGAAEKASAVRRVIVATHPDAAGDRYAAEVLSSVKKSVRWRPPSDLDETRSELTGLMGAAAKWLFIPHQLGD